jgi:hypothetical protein
MQHITKFIKCSLWSCASKFHIVIMHRTQSKILRAIAEAPWYVTNHTVEFKIWFSPHELFCNEKCLVRERMLFITSVATQNAIQNDSKQVTRSQAQPCWLKHNNTSPTIQYTQTPKSPTYVTLSMTESGNITPS